MMHFNCIKGWLFIEQSDWVYLLHVDIDICLDEMVYFLQKRNHHNCETLLSDKKKSLSLPLTCRHLYFCWWNGLFPAKENHHYSETLLSDKLELLTQYICIVFNLTFGLCIVFVTLLLHVCYNAITLKWCSSMGPADTLCHYAMPLLVFTFSLWNAIPGYG